MGSAASAVPAELQVSAADRPWEAVAAFEGLGARERWGRTKKKGPMERMLDIGPWVILPAATYSPTESPLQYHRR
jgi:hypothetical protein